MEVVYMEIVVRSKETHFSAGTAAVASDCVQRQRAEKQQLRCKRSSFIFCTQSASGLVDFMPARNERVSFSIDIITPL